MTIPTKDEIIAWSIKCADATRNGKADFYWAFKVQYYYLCGIVTAALAQWGQGTWQSIETAPTDGTPILVTGGKTDIEYPDIPEKERSRPVIAQLDKWFTYYDGGCHDGKYIKPTHWQPLPDEPPNP